MSFIKEHLLQNGSDVIDSNLMLDVRNVAPDLLTNLNNARLGNDLFKQLPRELREKYGNDVYKFATEFKQEDLDDFIKSKSNIINTDIKEGVSNENKE